MLTAKITWTYIEILRLARAPTWRDHAMGPELPTECKANTYFDANADLIIRWAGSSLVMIIQWLIMIEAAHAILVLIALSGESELIHRLASAFATRIHSVWFNITTGEMFALSCFNGKVNVRLQLKRWQLSCHLFWC